MKNFTMVALKHDGEVILMKILIVSPFFSPVIGGVESVVDTTCNKLGILGHSVKILTGAVEGLPAEERISPNVKLVRSELLQVPDTAIISARDFDFEGISSFFKDIIQDFEPSVIHFHNYQMQQYAMFLGAFFSSIDRKRQVVLDTIHNDTDDRFSRYFLSYFPFDQVLTVTRKASIDLFQGGIPPDKVTCIPNMVDTQKYCTADGKSVRRILGVDPSTPLILFPSRLVRREGDIFFDSVRGKGLDILFRALPEILERVPEAKILLLGNDPIFEEKVSQTKKELKQMAARIGADDSLLFFNQLIPNEMLPQVYSASDVVVSLSSRETFGMVFLEGMAAGKPVVGVNSQVGGVPEVVPDRLAGFLVPKNNSHLTARAITKILLDEDLRKHMGFNGLKWVRQKFDARIVLPKMIGTYNSLIREKMITADQRVQPTPFASLKSLQASENSEAEDELI